jgi:hypothetical protein
MASLSSEERQAAMSEWMDWAGRSGESLAEFGSPLGEADKVGSSASINGHVTGYSILETSSRQAALELLDGHPHLSGPGETSIEVLEFLAPPRQ